MNLVQKILLERYDDAILDKKIKNSKTGREVKVSSALNYPDGDPVKKKALALLKKADKSTVETPKASTKTTAKTDQTSKKNTRSHKPKSNSYGISKECVEFLKEKGLTGLNVYPQSFVKIDQIQFNPEIKSKGKDSVWVVKFPVILPNGKESYKTAYTREFMKNSQSAKYKKISKIKTKDIQDLEEKTQKLLQHKDKAVADSAAILGIILKTGLRIGSVDEAETGNVGVRTLKKENVQIKGDKIKLNFIGKSYQENVAELEDPAIANYLKESLSDKQPKDRVFSASYGLVGKVMDKINPKGINPKDLRTYKATEIAKQFLQSKSLGVPPPLPDDEKLIKKAVKEKLKKVFEQVATYLNNTPAMARNSYVHPVVITDFLKTLNLKPKEVGYKHITMEAKESKGYKFTSMDEMFSNIKDDGTDSNYSDITDDMYDCEEYLLPEWWWNDNIDLVKIK